MFDDHIFNFYVFEDVVGSTFDAELVEVAADGACVEAELVLY